MQPHDIDGHYLRDWEHIPGTQDLWLAQATRAVKNPGKGEYRLVLLGPKTNTQSHRTELVDGYTLRGDAKLHDFACDVFDREGSFA